MYICVKCHMFYKKYSPKCVCGKYRTIIRFDQTPIVPTERMMTAEEISNRKMNNKFIPGFEFLGKLPRKWSALVSGPPGQGKSSFALLLASTIAKQKRNFLYWAYEERQSEELQKKLQLFEIQDKNLVISVADNFQEFVAEMKRINAAAIAIDSISDANIEKEHLKEIKRILDGPALYVAHYTKAGQYKGESGLEHDITISIDVRDGKATTLKNRFAVKGQKMNIFEGVGDEQ